MHTQHEPRTRIDIPPLTAWGRARAMLKVACSRIDVSLIALLILLPLAAFGFCVLECPDLGVVHEVQGLGVSAFGSSVVLEAFCMSYAVAAWFFLALRRWRVSRDIALAIGLMLAVLT